MCPQTTPFRVLEEMKWKRSRVKDFVSACWILGAPSLLCRKSCAQRLERGKELWVSFLPSLPASWTGWGPQAVPTGQVKGRGGTCGDAVGAPCGDAVGARGKGCCSWGAPQASSGGCCTDQNCSLAMGGWAEEREKQNSSFYKGRHRIVTCWNLLCFPLQGTWHFYW